MDYPSVNGPVDLILSLAYVVLFGIVIALTYRSLGRRNKGS